MENYPFTKAWMDAINKHTERLDSSSKRDTENARHNFEEITRLRVVTSVRLQKLADVLGIKFDATDWDYARAFAATVGTAIFDESKSADEAYDAAHVAGCTARGKAKELRRDAKPRISRSGVPGACIEVGE